MAVLGGDEEGSAPAAVLVVDADASIQQQVDDGDGGFRASPVDGSHSDSVEGL